MSWRIISIWHKPEVYASGLCVFKNALSIFLVVICTVACGVREPKSEKTIKDLERAIKVLEERRDAEIRAIDQELTQINQLEANKHNARSQGMRDKIERDITMKETVLERARHNKENQEKILEGLYLKRDSLLQI